MSNENNKQKQTCKFFHHEPYMTPNNYDLEFDYHNIPSNIEIESSADLRKRMQRTLPLSKIVHIKLHSEKATQYNELHIMTSTKLKFIKNDTYTEVVLK